MIGPNLIDQLFPYTTLFRSETKERFMWPRTDFLELLGITHPIVQAPMSGSISPTQAAAVSNAGHWRRLPLADRKSTRLNSSHSSISYAVFCMKKKNRVCHLA